MVSLREIADCIEAPENFSVLRDFFGFIQRRVPTDPVDPADADWERTQVSILERIRLLRGEYYNVNVIAVGWDNFTADDRTEMYYRSDYAIYRSHQIYAQQDIGVGRIRYFFINSDDADGLDTLDSDAELDELTERASVDNDGLDVFIVFNMNLGILGRSDICGPCEGIETNSDDDRCDSNERDGSVVGPWNGLQLARTFAHEMGHYLGLAHNHGGEDDCPNNTTGCNNLMAQTRCATSCGDGLRRSVLLTNAQGNRIRMHCSIHQGC